MAFIAFQDFQRQGGALNSEMGALNEAIARVVADQRNRGGELVPFPDGPWAQRWQGFYSSWTRYYQEQVIPTPVLPVHDDGDLQTWTRELADWKADFAKGQTQNAAAQLRGSTATTGGGTLKLFAILAALVVGGYVLSQKRAFS